MPEANSDADAKLLIHVAEGLQDTTADFSGLVKRLVVHQPALLEIRAKLQRELAEARERVRMPNYKPDPKDKDTPRYTDLDRRVMMEAAVAELNERYELAKGLEELVKERVDLIKTLLRS